MKIADVKLIRLVGHSDEDWTRSEARSAAPLDAYEEFRARGPENEAPREGPAHIEAIYLQVLADDGPTGLYGPISAEQAFLVARRLRPFLLGRDGLAISTLWDQMTRLDRHARCGLFMMAISAVDNALWDLAGKRYGQPVWRLLGGPTRRRIAAYASMLGHSLEPRRAAERAREVAGRGFPAQKWFFRHGPGSGAAGRQENLRLARTLREAVGDGCDLMFDCWMGWDLPYAVSMARGLLPLGPKWLEEPFPPNRLKAFAELKRATGIPLAAGEHLYTRWEVEPFLDAAALDFIQVDPDWTGGISELVRICDLASTRGVPVVPHGHNLHAALHVVASRPPDVCPLAEYLIRHLARQQFFLTDPLEPHDGHLDLPTAPGLGMELDHTRIEDRQELSWP